MLYCIARVILYDNQKKDCQDCGKIKGVYIWMRCSCNLPEVGTYTFFALSRTKCQFD